MLVTPAPPPVLQLRSASFGYADRPVIHDLTLEVQPGEVVAILGANGSGKSTLLKGILGLAQQAGGQSLILGSPLHHLRERHRVGYVPQRHTLASSVRATVREVVASGRLTRRGMLSLPGRADRIAVDTALELVGLSGRAGSDVATLSGGQHRRVLIARALAGQPDLLLMDEPLAGVDATAQHSLADVLHRLVRTGVTLVIVTHELAAIAPLITRVVVIDHGTITFDGAREKFEKVAGRVLHDHGFHHHDDEPDPSDATPGWHPNPLQRGDDAR